MLLYQQRIQIEICCPFSSNIAQKVAPGIITVTLKSIKQSKLDMLRLINPVPCHQDALQQRMAVQESSVLQLKQELLRTSMAKDELAGQNVSAAVFMLCILNSFQLYHI